jgi:hypothetical protein
MKKIISIIMFVTSFSAQIFTSEIEYFNVESGGGDQEYKVLLILEKINQKNDEDSCEVSALKAMFLVELDILVGRTKNYISSMKNYLSSLKRDLQNNKWSDDNLKKRTEELYYSYLKKFEQDEEKLRLRESWLKHPPFNN